jgi:hypothetical protein
VIADATNRQPRVIVPSQVDTLAGTALPVNQVVVTFLVSV